MTYDQEYWKNRLPFVSALAEGKTVQYLHKGEWFDWHGRELFEPIDDYRIIAKPATKLVPWTIDTCPIGSVIRRKNDEQRCLLLSWQQTGAYCQTWGWVRYSTMLEEFERLKPDDTWGPCGIEVTPLQKAPDIT